MSEFLNQSELTERRAFIETFVKEIVVMPGDALLRYTIPMPDDSPIPGRNAEEIVLNGSVLSTVKNGGLAWTRTPTLPNCRTHRNENRENIAARRSNSAPPEICLFSRKMNIQHFVNVHA